MAFAPMFYSQQSTGTPSVSAAPPAAVINNPQSFVVPMGSQPATYPQYTAPPSGSYTYPYSIPPFYPPTATPPAPVPPAPPSHSAASTGANQGGWSEEEVQKLKRLHEESKAQQFTEDQTWDWVIQQYGPTRTRYGVCPLKCIASVEALLQTSDPHQGYVPWPEGELGQGSEETTSEQ